MFIDVVIVNWNSGRSLDRCLERLASFCDESISKTIVVDNGSEDGSLYSIAVEEKITLIKNKRNLGFSKACNQGAQEGESPWILFLNPDTLVHENIFKNRELNNAMERKEVAVIGLAQRNNEDVVARSCCRRVSFRNMAAHVLGIDRLFPSLGYLMTDWDHLSSQSVHHVIGSFYLIRRNVFELLEGFDENFFVYMEDLDLSSRVKKSGWEIRYLAKPEIFHEGGGSSKNVKLERLIYDLQSRHYFIKKYFSFFQSKILISLQKFVEPIVRFVFNFKEIKLTWFAYKVYWKQNSFT